VKLSGKIINSTKNKKQKFKFEKKKKNELIMSKYENRAIIIRITIRTTKGPESLLFYHASYWNCFRCRCFLFFKVKNDKKMTDWSHI